ncbi:hypothetical protein JEZ13_03860 [bacterium]|nr:hypothetical protein [bacterium]
MKKILCLTLSMIFSACALLSFTIFADSEEFSITEETLPVLLSSFQALPSLETYVPEIYNEGYFIPSFS